MAKAVAIANGWGWESHADFSHVMNNARNATGNDQLWTLRAMANDLHGNYHQREEFLDAEAITAGINQIETLLNLLALLANWTTNTNLPVPAPRGEPLGLPLPTSWTIPPCVHVPSSLPVPSP